MANPNPDNNTPNQSTKPINPSVVNIADKVVDFTGIDLSKDDGFASRIGKSTVGVSTVESQNFDWAKINEKIRNKVVEQEYDGLWSGTTKWAGSTLNSAATFLLDFGGALFDPADWRLPDVPSDVDSDFRDTRKGGYINSIFKWLDNNTVFGDTEDLTGNWMTRTSSDWREYNEVYRTIKSGNEYADFWLNGSANIVGSALGTFGQGALVKYGLQAARYGLRAAQGINAIQQGVRAGEGISKVQSLLSTGAGAFIMTQATGMSIAEGVHDEVYKQKLYDLSPNLENAELSEYQKIYDETLAKTKNAKDAEYAARMGVKEFRKNFGEQNPELHTSAIKAAGKGAEASLQMMFPAFLLNLTMSSAFTKAFVGTVSNKVTRNIISKSPFSKKEILGEGLQEVIEEAGVENIAEDYGIAVGMDKNYTISDAWNKVFSWENLGTAALAFVGGSATKAVIDFAGSGAHKKNYEKQQTFIKRWNEIGAAVGQPDVVQQLTAPVRSAQELQKVLKELETLESQGKTEEAKEKSKQILALQAYDAYESGTTKILIDNWTQIANSKDVKPEARKAARIAIQEIQSMEKEFNESLKYENGRSVFKNRVNHKQLTNYTQQLKNEIAQKKIEAQLEVGLLKQSGKLDLSYDESIQEQTEIEWNKDGTIKEVITPFKVEKKQMDLELTSKGYVSSVEGVDASKQVNQIKQSVKSYQEFLDLNEQLESIEMQIVDMNTAHAEMTTKENQKNLKYQNMVLEEYLSMKGDLDALVGTDEYMKEVDSKILNYYKNKMDPKAFNLFRQEVFVNKNNLEKALTELANKSQLETGLKSNKDIENDAKELSEKSAKEIPFANVPKETKIELVANKLVLNQPLTAEEERFKNANSIKVENKRIEIEKTKKSSQPTGKEVTPEVVNEEGTSTDEKAGIAQNINNIVEAEPKPKTPEVKIESKIDTIIKSTNANLNEQQREALERELNKEKPNVAVVGKLLGDIKKPVAQQIINEYKLNQEAVDNNTDVELINFSNDLKKQIDESGQNVINFDLDTNEDGDLTEKGKKQLELINRLLASNNTELSIVPNKTIENRYKIALPISNDPKEDSDAAIEDDLKSLDPKEVDDRLSPEAKNQLKEQIGDYLIALEDELGSEPTFEKFIRDYIVNSSKEQAKILFDTLALGWQLNGMPIENYKEAYDKIFRSRKEMANSLMQFAEEQQLVQETTTKELNKVNLETNTTNKAVETASGETVMVPIPLGDTVFRLGYNSTSVSPRLIKIEDEDGNLVARIESLEEDSPDKFLKYKKLLRRDKFTSGTQLSVQIPIDNLDEVLIKDRDEKGQIKEVNGKPVLITFKEWLAKNLKEKGIEFLNSQAYYDSVPLIVKDSDGDFVAYIHDISKVELNNELTPEQRTKQIADVRALRKYLIDTEKKGGEPKIEITAKVSGLTETYADGQSKKVRSVNSKAVLAKGIINNASQLTHVYVSVGGKAEIMTADAFYEKYKISDYNRNLTREELRKGNTVDIREWSEGGEHKIFTTIFPKLSEEIVESIMNVLTIGISEGSKSNLQGNLKKKFGSESIEDYLKKFIIMVNPQTVRNGNRYFEVKNFGRGPIMFGVKGGEEIVINNANDLNNHKEKLLKFLSEQQLITKNKLNTDKLSLQSNDFKMGLVEEDGSIIDSPFDYFEYSIKDAENKIRLENIGTAENPHFITKFQPNIEFKPIAPPNRNSNNYNSPKTETKEENKQLNNLVASTYTDEQLKKELPKLEAQGFEFIGNTIDEKIADVKKLLSENTNESTELAKQLDENLKEKLEQKAETTSNLNQAAIDKIEADKKAKLEKLGQKQLTIGFNNLSEATKLKQVANAIAFIEQNKRQGARLSKEQEQQLVEAKAKLKEEGYEIIDYNVVRKEDKTIVQGEVDYNSETDVLTEEQAKAIESRINTLEKIGEGVHVDDLPSPVAAIIKPLIMKDGKMVQPAEVNILAFKTVEQAKEAVKKSKEAGYKKPNAADKIDAQYNAELKALEQEGKSETNEQKVERLRAEEQVALLEAIPELESYKVDGEIDENLMSNEVKEKYNEIYNKYDSLITPLLFKETTTPLEGFEEFFNIFAESSNVDEAIQKLIDNKTITKVCK